MKINKWLIGGVALVAGIAAGSGVTYLIMHKREKDEEEAILYQLDHYCDACDASSEISLIDHASQQDASFSEEYRIFLERAKSIVEASRGLKNDSGESNEVKNSSEPIIAPFMVNPNVESVVQSYSTAVQNESSATTPYVSPAEDRAYLEFMEAKKRERAERIKKKFTRYDKIDRMYEDGGSLEDPNDIQKVEKEVDEVQLQINNYQPEKPVHIITPEQFANECWGYEKTTLQWWKRNNLMSTEDYEIIDIPDILGTEWVDRIGEFEPNIVYVRNDDSGTDYEIIATEDNFYDFNAG